MLAPDPTNNNMCVPAIGYKSAASSADANAKRPAVQNQLPTGDFVLIHVDLVDDKAPAIFGKLASEYSSYALRSIISTVVEAKAIDVVMRVDKSMMTSLDWWQGLFALRHSPSIAWHKTDLDKGQGSAFWCISEIQVPDDEKTLWRTADSVAHGLLTADVKLPLPPWLVGSEEHESFSKTQVQPFGEQVMPRFVDRVGFETPCFPMLGIELQWVPSLLRERDVQRTMLLKTIPPVSTHTATFHRIGSTQVFIIQLRLSRLSNETTKPAEVCRLQLKRPNSETKYEAFVVADIPQAWGLALMSITPDTLAVSSIEPEKVQVTLEDPEWLVDNLASGVAAATLLMDAGSKQTSRI
ncbi:uncharacterized protein BKCO1_610004 [Diplodia corticola]|uniref:Uncharacterized protein n=1 Tax=Diplodia corticola TaxID=236234 RepID=A0A1J9QPM1_9PEZI|nr:uncharacterized protein BKCO1_610004 [Diplodia corticola]OJD30409.1 hypothetical protein BKCO1_610004 [Diplodia corticola]